jgi:dCMP deaminase
MDWDKYFMSMACLVALKSKDESTKVGAIIIGDQKEILATGYNGFPRMADESIPERHKRPDKYIWTEHAERNAIYNAARTGCKLSGCTMYTPFFPCTNCARAIIQSGIRTIVTTPVCTPNWEEDLKVSKVMLGECGVNHIVYSGPIQRELYLFVGGQKQ